jgi:hypothetical protein
MIHLRRKNLVGGTIAVFVVLAAVILYRFTRSPSPFPASVRKTADFALYYPAELPQGWLVDKNSISASNQLVVYAVTDGKRHKFTVNMQPVARNFDFSSFKKQYKNGDEFTADSGSAFTAKNALQLVAVVQTPENSLIIINTRSVTAKTELATLVRSLEIAE